MNDLFDYYQPYRAYARTTDPETSHESAKAIERHLPPVEAKMLKAIPFAPADATLDEVMDATGLEKVTVSPRFKPMEEKGLIVRTGARLGHSNRQQTSWQRVAK